MCWRRIPDFYDRLKQSYDAKFFEQEALGEYLNVQAGRGLSGIQAVAERAGKMEVDRHAAVVLGPGLQCGSDEFDCGAEERRGDPGAG